MSLKHILHELVEEFERPGTGIDVHAAIQAGRPRVMADPDALVILVDEGLARRLTQVATRQLKLMEETAANEGRQRDLFAAFGLRPRYALDSDDRIIKRTDWLTRDEFRSLIDLREQQLVADLGHLDKLRQAERTLRRLWNQNPELTFGEVVRLYHEHERSAA